MDAGITHTSNIGTHRTILYERINVSGVFVSASLRIYKNKCFMKYPSFRLQEDVEFIVWALGEADSVFVWSTTVCFIILFIFRPVFQFWVSFKLNENNRKWKFYRLTEYALKVLYIGFYVGLFHSAHQYNFKSPFANLGLCMEAVKRKVYKINVSFVFSLQFRYVMKLHSYVIETNANPQEYKNTTVWQLAFFLVAPFVRFGRKCER